MVLLLLVAVWLSCSVAIFDSDFWWHLATGRWIWQQGALPQSDPFNFTSTDFSPTLRTGLVLKGYWLAQLILYAAYRIDGFEAVIVLRATLVTCAVACLFVFLRRWRVSYWLAGLSIWLAAAVIVQELQYIGARPQLWTSLFFPLLLLLLERVRAGWRWARAAMLLLMLLWANLHGGYVFGVVVVGIYALVAALRRELPRSLALWLAAAVLVTLLNPNGPAAFVGVWRSLFDSQSGAYSSQIVEGQSLFAHGGFAGVLRRMPILVALTGISAASYLVYLRTWRRPLPELLALYLLTAAMGAQSIRYLIFFACVAALVAAGNLQVLLDRLAGLRGGLAWGRRLLPIASLLLLLPAYDLGAQGWRATALGRDRTHHHSHWAAAAFLNKLGMRGRVFNDYAAGGFLIWALSPDVQVFADGRALHLESFELFRQVADAPTSLVPGTRRTVAEKTFSDYSIDVVVLPGCDAVSGTVIPLSFVLLNSPGWAVVYADAGVIVHVRRRAETNALLARHERPKRDGFRNILTMATAAQRSPHARYMPQIKLSLAVGFMGIGDKARARSMISRYLLERPNEPNGLAIRKRIEAMPDAADGAGSEALSSETR